MSELLDIHCPYCATAITGTRTGIGEATASHIGQCAAAPESIRGLLEAHGGEDSHTPARLEPDEDKRGRPALL